MSLLRLIIVSFLHHWRMNFAVALGAAVGTAVLTGALLVGDSMRGSLRALALDRLGKIDEVLAPGRFFREKLADELKETDDFKKFGDSLVPAILLPASMENPNTETQANRVQVIGCQKEFWQLGVGGPKEMPNAREIDLNQPLAEKLGVKTGDTVLLRLPRPSVIPSDSALGEKRDTVSSYRLSVRSILPAAGLARFSLKPNQQEPLNAYVPLDWLQERLEQPAKVNALFLALNAIGKENEKIWSQLPQIPVTSENIFSKWLRYFIPSTSRRFTSDLDLPFGQFPYGYQFGESRGPFLKLEDIGIHIQINPRGFLDLQSESMIIEEPIEHEIFQQNANSFSSVGGLDRPMYLNGSTQPILTYLANSIADNDREIPYSTITAIDFNNYSMFKSFFIKRGAPGFPKYVLMSSLKNDEIALNSWAADDLKAELGDTIKITYFQPESIHGKISEKTVEFRLAAIVQLTDAADDRTLTPPVKGITDELTMAGWDPPFPFDAKRIRPQDEKYWNDYGPTPKAFISLATGRKLWGSRFGQTTSIRIGKNYKNKEAAESDLNTIREKVTFRASSLGFVWQPVKLQGLAAAQGTTPFNVLFLCFSFFIIVSALMLVLLMFKLGVERRAAEIGILLAVGWKPQQVRKLLFREGALTALFGGLLGIPLGIGYAALMLWGLQTWWLSAIVTPFLKLYVTPGSLLIGFIAGFFMGLVTIFLVIRKISRIAPRRLLAGIAHDAPETPISRLAAFPASLSTPLIRRLAFPASWIDILWLILFSANLLFWFFARRLSDLEAGMFFGSGALMLLLTLLVLWNRLRRGATGAAVTMGGGNLFRLAIRNAARNPGRSVLTIGLVASACFLIVAVSAFQLDPSQQTPSLASGNGGFAISAESSQPIFQNLDTPDGRAALGFSDADEKILASCKIYSLRIRTGDDASCLNLYKPRSPRILGLPQDFLARGGFAWANAPAKGENPWRLLEPRNLDVKSEVPMILEKNTANYSLNLWGGLGEQYWLSDRSFELRVAALLDNSIFQGDLLVSEEALLIKFPETVGYRFFLVECPPEKTDEVQKILENQLGDFGLAAETTGQRLARFLAVQNTYLSTFQSLGGLGLLLGTLGLAAVQLRNVLERRGELALMRAVGFSRKKLAKLVLLENAVLLTLGLGSGVLAALIAVTPHFLTSNAQVPWLSLLGTLGLVFLAGMLAGLAAVRQVLKAPLLNALREER